MKKINIYRIINIILIITFAIINFLQYQTEIFGFHIDNFWFIAFLFAIGTSMLFKSILFKSDSVLWLSIVLLLCGAGIIMFNVADLPFSKYWTLAIVIPAFASVVVGVIFKNIFHIKSAIFLLIVSVPIFCFTFELINVWWFVVMQIISLWIAIILFRLMPEKWFGKK